jgi:excisionase family DNA binding protein
MTHIPEGNYFTLLEAAEFAGVSKITVQKWTQHGLIEFIQLPRLGQIIHEDVLKEFLKKERPVGFPKGRSRKQAES